MASTMTDHQRVVFENAAFHVAQQKDTRLSGLFTQTVLEGKQKYFQVYGDAELVEKTSRGQETTFSELTRTRRSISPRTFSRTEFFDEDDEVNLMTDAGPNQHLLDAYAWAAARKKDDVIIEAIDADAKTGETGGTDISFDDTNQEIDLTSVSVTLTSLLDALEILWSADIDPDAQINCICHPADIRILMGIEKLSSGDYQQLLALSTGQSPMWLGMNWVTTTRLQIGGGLFAGANQRPIYICTGDSMVFGMHKGVTVKHSERPDLSDGSQVRIKGTMAASRIFENKIVQILHTPSIPASGND